MSVKLNVKNRTLFHGDNLNFLRGINSDCIDLIATDPPFKKDRDFHATPDSLAAGASFQDRWSWKDDVEQEWIDQVTDDYPLLMGAIETARYAHSDGMGAFMCFMAVRLIEMRRVLKPSGSIYLHCDPTASHYLKAIMDAIFGHKNFVNDIVWRRATSHNDAGRFGNITDNILLYAKMNSKRYWDGQSITTEKTPKNMEESYPMRDKRGRYRSADLSGPLHNAERGAPSTLPWRKYDVYKLGRCWSVPKTGAYADFISKKFIPGYSDIKGVHDRLDALDKAGLIHHPTSGKWPGLKRYAIADTGNPPQNIILEPIGFTNYNKSEEVTGYATQKPLALYSLFIKASCPKKKGIVLDPFAGCATTLVAAEKLKRQWIGMDIWDDAHEMVIDRLKKEVFLSGPGGDKGGRLITEGEITYTKEPPKRTDDGEEAVPFLKTKLKVAEPKGVKRTRAEMLEFLLSQHGSKCQGCDREFDDARYLELDHNTPRSQGGLNHISNRILLCGPCNKVKSNLYTLEGLRQQNKQRGHMAK